MEPYSNFNGTPSDITTNQSSSNVSSDAYYYYYYYYNEDVQQPYSVQDLSDHFIVLAVIFPLIGILTILGNFIVVYIFCKQRIRTPTSVLLIELAVANTLVCLPIIVVHVYIYSMQNYRTYLKYEWCIVHHVGYLFQQVFRSTANWLIAMLGVQRYIAVSWPFRAQHICTVKMSVVSFFVFLVGSLVVYSNEAISIEIKPLFINSSLAPGCTRGIPSWYSESVSDMRTSVMLYYIFNGLLTRFLPCVVLLFTTCSLVRCLCCGPVGVGRSIQESYSSNEKLRRTNILVLTILIVFLIAELQDAVAFCIYSYELAVDKPRSVLKEGTDDIWDIYGMVVTLAGYHCIFWIFFLMSAQFRQALKQTLCKCNIRTPKDDSVVRVSILRHSTKSGNSLSHT